MVKDSIDIRISLQLDEIIVLIYLPCRVDVSYKKLNVYDKQ